VEGFDTAQIKPFGLLKRLGEKVSRFLRGRPKSLPNETEQIATKAEDLTYNLTLDSEEAQRGTWVTIAIDRGQGREKLKVRIPPGTRSGTRLRLKGKGLIQDRGTGDLYLTVHLAQ
jgi:DnaJ-class molecular chaperone